VRTASDKLVALTDSGNLLVFETGTFSLRGERVPSVRATCLGPTRGDEVIVGLQDGRIVTFDASSLKMSLVGAVTGEPLWIGRTPIGTLLVVRGYPREDGGRRGWNHVARVSLEDISGNKRLWLPFVPTVFLRDSRGRLWLGAERGEWGGSLGVVDLTAWTVREIAHENTDGVYGLTETSDGRVLAYGGAWHMGVGTFVASIDGSAPHNLYRVPYLGKAPPDRPRLPITNVVELTAGTFLVFAYDDVFEVDTTFAKWRRSKPFEAHYELGRADAVGTYPAIRSVQVLDPVARRVAIATGLDGWVEMRGERFIAHPLAGQLGADNVDAFSFSAGRLVARSYGDSWTLGSSGWKRVWAPSPVVLPQVAQNGSVPHTAFLPRADGKVFAVFRDEPNYQFGFDPRLVATALCEGERCVPLGQGIHPLLPSAVFLTPDDAPWALDPAGLWRFRQSTWSLAVARESTGAGTASLPLNKVLTVFKKSRPPWVVLGQGGFATLSTDGPDGAPILGTLPWPADGVADASSCGGRIFSATADDVYELILDQRRWSHRLRPQIGPIKHLGCDGKGRLLLVARRVWTVDGEHLTPVPLAASLPADIDALESDGGDSFVAAIAGRGAALIRPADATSPSAHGFSDEGDRPSGVREMQEVHVSIGHSESESGLVEELDEALASQRAGGFVGLYLGDEDGLRASFVGVDAARIAELLRPILASRLPKATVVVRPGPPGTPERQVPIQPAAQ
jgi:hypothetical protein